jgi:hypothetical protein
MRSVALPVEDRLSGRRHRLRCEAEFDERTDALRQQIVIELVDLAPVVHRAPVDDTNRAQHIVKDVVETDVTKT